MRNGWTNLRKIETDWNCTFEDLLAWKFSQVYFFDMKLLFCHLQVIFSSSVETKDTWFGIIHKMNETATVTRPL